MSEINAGLDNYGETPPDTPLRSLLIVLNKRRKTFMFFSVAVTVLIIVMAAFIYLGQVRQQVTSLKFKIDFKGVEENRYPNGMKFSTSDIVSSEVMDQVYKQDNLKKYMDFSDFKAAITIIQTSNKLKFLEFEYAGKLSNRKLDVQERERIEAEFREKKRSARVPIYNLEFFQDTRASSIPLKVQAKILNDILETWARVAVQSKGGADYQVSVISANVLNKEEIENLNYFIATDLLRLTTKRIKNDIQEVRKLPGAEVLEIGKKGLKLGDIYYRLEDLEKFKLNPLAGFLRRTKPTLHLDEVLAYLENQIFELKLKYDKAVSYIDLYRDSLDRYLSESTRDYTSKEAGRDHPGAPTIEMGTTIPQLGESFLQSVITMARKNMDVEFRQKLTLDIISVGKDKSAIEYELQYYRDIYERITKPEETVPSGEAEPQENSLKRFKTSQLEIYDQLSEAIDNLNEFYNKLSKINLIPESRLYTVMEPVMSKTLKSLNTRRLILLMILAWIVAEGVIIAGIRWKSLFPTRTS